MTKLSHQAWSQFNPIFFKNITKITGHQSICSNANPSTEKILIWKIGLVEEKEAWIRCNLFPK